MEHSRDYQRWIVDGAGLEAGEAEHDPEQGAWVGWPELGEVGGLLSSRLLGLALVVVVCHRL